MDELPQTPKRDGAEVGGKVDHESVEVHINILLSSQGKTDHGGGSLLSPIHVQNQVSFIPGPKFVVVIEFTRVAALGRCQIMHYANLPNLSRDRSLIFGGSASSSST